MDNRERALRELRFHIPAAYGAGAEHWIQCSCGWNREGHSTTDEEWHKHITEALGEARAAIEGESRDSKCQVPVRENSKALIEKWRTAKNLSSDPARAMTYGYCADELEGVVTGLMGLIKLMRESTHPDAMVREQLKAAANLMEEIVGGRAERVLEAAPCDESPDPICPRCMGTGKYQRFPTEPQKDCAICNGTGRIAEVAPLPTAREHAAFTMHCPKCGIDVFAHGETCPQPVSEARLRELVAKWRKEVEHASSEFEEGEQYGTNQCAAELERALESA
jgi:hypothetical protein